MLDSFRELIDELLSAPAALRGLGIGDSDETETREALALLTERDKTVLEQIQKMVRTDDPVLPTPSTNVAAGAMESSSSALLDAFDTWRGELVSLLMNLTLKDWERTAIDHLGRQVSVADFVETHVEFDEAMREKFETLLG
jgi:hypothetical protein